tara:strand:+ start:855 stop:1067 length:213 start_codon:yes stop_codon:yes gene_type:complete
MDAITHTLIAISCMLGAYTWGRYSTASIADVVGSMLDRLEEDGYVATKVDKNGDKELILIRDVIKDLDKS